MRRLSLLLLAAPLVGCEPPVVNCTEEARPGIVVRLDDGEGPVCDAIITLVAEGREEVLDDGFVDGDACVFSGAIEAPGEYTVGVDAVGFNPEERTVSVGEDECHVLTETLEISLTVDCPEEPNPGLDVIVRDPESQPLCNVSVRAFEGPVDAPTYEEDLERIQLGPGNCRYVGLFDRPGTYALAIDAAAPFVDLVTEAEHEVTEDVCGVVRTEVGLRLERDAG